MQLLLRQKQSCSACSCTDKRTCLVCKCILLKEMEKSLKYEKFQTSQKKRPTAPIVPITNIQQLPVFCHILQFL